MSDPWSKNIRFAWLLVKWTKIMYYISRIKFVANLLGLVAVRLFGFQEACRGGDNLQLRRNVCRFLIP